MMVVQVTHSRTTNTKMLLSVEHRMMVIEDLAEVEQESKSEK